MTHTDPRDELEQTILVRYSCPECDLSDVEVPVTARGEEGVLEWTEQMIRVLSADHARRSPDCQPDSLHDIKIPITGAEQIGGPAIQ